MTFTPIHLLSKVQYKNYEVGEFSLKKERNLEDTITLIKQYPWDKNRHLADVKLTCPSVTIEHINGSFLKIGHYFSGKFCLYLLTEQGNLRSKVITKLEDSFPVTAAFYNNENISADFEPATLTFNAKKHFVTKLFEYRITFKRALAYLFYPVIIFTLFILLVLGSAETRSDFNIYVKLLIIFLVWFVINGANIYLFLNYYFYSNKLYLKLSRGHNNFFFGTYENQREYFKSDIELIRQYFHKGSRNPWGDNIVYEIYFRNGERIRFPSLLIGGMAFDKKMEGIKKEQVHRFLATINK